MKLSILATILGLIAVTSGLECNQTRQITNFGQRDSFRAIRKTNNTCSDNHDGCFVKFESKSFSGLNRVATTTVQSKGCTNSDRCNRIFNNSNTTNCLITRHRFDSWYPTNYTDDNLNAICDENFTRNSTEFEQRVTVIRRNLTTGLACCQSDNCNNANLFREESKCQTRNDFSNFSRDAYQCFNKFRVSYFKYFLCGQGRKIGHYLRDTKCIVDNRRDGKMKGNNGASSQQKRACYRRNTCPIGVRKILASTFKCACDKLREQGAMAVRRYGDELQAVLGQRFGDVCPALKFRCGNSNETENNGTNKNFGRLRMYRRIRRIIRKLKLKSALRKLAKQAIERLLEKLSDAYKMDCVYANGTNNTDASCVLTSNDPTANSTRRRLAEENVAYVDIKTDTTTDTTEAPEIKDEEIVAVSGECTNEQDITVDSETGSTSSNPANCQFNAGTISTTKNDNSSPKILGLISLLFSFIVGSMLF